MAFDLSTPGAQLAWGVAQRAQEVQDYKDKLEAEARARVQAQLAPFGNDLTQPASTFDSIYGPAAATQQARAKAMQEYVTGLPELLARVQAEKLAASRGGGGGGGGGGKFVPQPYVSPEDFINFLLALNTPPPTTPATTTPATTTPAGSNNQPLVPGYDWSKVKGWGA